jgi:uncharacterized membrane protein
MFSIILLSLLPYIIIYVIAVIIASLIFYSLFGGRQGFFKILIIFAFFNIAGIIVLAIIDNGEKHGREEKRRNKTRRSNRGNAQKGRAKIAGSGRSFKTGL